MDGTVVITLFRHGLTEGNRRKQYMGWNDSPLSMEAITQLSSYQLDEQAYDLYVCSDLNRCLHTIKLLFPKVEPKTVMEFREMHFGDFQGKTYEQLKDDISYQKWLENSVIHAPPNGESFEQFANRVDAGWERICRYVHEEDGARPFIVTHGGVIKYLLSRFAPIQKPFWDWRIVHGTGYELLFDVEQLRRGNRCISLREVPLMEKENG
jgi:alpha-ribazole phosphatase